MKDVCNMHGTVGFLPTMITCDFADCLKALNIVKEYVEAHQDNNWVLGIHLEGPFISKEKWGIHTESLIQEA